MGEDSKTSELNDMLDMPSFEDEFLSGNRGDILTPFGRSHICPKCGGSMIKITNGRYSCPKAPHDIEDDNQSFYDEQIAVDRLQDLGEL